MLSVKICFWCKNIVFSVNCSVLETVVLLYVFFILIYKETSLCALAILTQAVNSLYGVCLIICFFRDFVCCRTVTCN